MAMPRGILKQLVTEVPICEQRSYSGTIAAGGGQALSEVFNLTLVSFLNPFGLADPAMDTRLAGGHVLYLDVFYTGATAAVEVNIVASAGPAPLPLRLLSAPASIAPFAVPPSTATVFRTDLLGAVWDCQIVLINSGVGIATFEMAVGFRAR